MTWVQIDCRTRDALYAARVLRPLSGFTDMDGQYGEPHIFTEWGVDDEPVLRDYRWPSRRAGAPDARPCRHERYGQEGGDGGA